MVELISERTCGASMERVTESVAIPASRSDNMSAARRERVMVALRSARTSAGSMERVMTIERLRSFRTSAESMPRVISTVLLRSLRKAVDNMSRVMLPFWMAAFCCGMATEALRSARISAASIERVMAPGSTALARFARFAMSAARAWGTEVIP